MSVGVTLSFACPHCHHAIDVRLGTMATPPGAPMPPRPPAPPAASILGEVARTPSQVLGLKVQAVPIAPSAKGAVCGCGHERGWHLHGLGICGYGSDTHGSCGCQKYHSRRSKPSTAAKDNAGPSPREIAARKCEGAILSCLLTESLPVSRTRLALRTLYSNDAGGFVNALGALRGADLVDDVDGGGILISDAGRQLVEPRDIPVGRAVVVDWIEKKRLGKCENEILVALLEALPGRLPSRSAIAAKTASRYSADAGGFGNALGHLRTVGLLVDFDLNPEMF